MEYGTRKPVRDMTLAETAQMGVAEGVGVAGGFVGAGILGRQVENLVKKNVTTSSSMSDKLMAGLGNNLPKVAVWYLLKQYGPEPKPGDMVSEVAVDVKKSMMGSVFYDVMLRAANHGVNETRIKLGSVDILSGKPEPKGIDVNTYNRQIAAMRQEETRKLQGESRKVQSVQGDLQKVVQENSYLRQQLNEALGRLANAAKPPVAIAPVVQQPIARPAPVQVVQQPAPIVRVTPVATPVVASPEDRRKHGFMGEPEPMQTTPEAEERRRKFGSMPTYDAPPIIEERERRYGFMGKASKSEQVAAMYGML
jgi:hypothetical protein